MSRRMLDRIREAIRHGDYDITAHACAEMAEDGHDLIDVETSILRGNMERTETGDLPETSYDILGMAADTMTALTTVGRFTAIGHYLIITVYESEEPAA